ncbi:MAG: hypothetical protein QF570_17945 [Myxococcota bacterium]|jgi:hypothetical protein|nr:hypothetical protein [Myxococcota bacterium]
MRVVRAFVFAPIVASLVLTACIGDPWRSVNKKNTLADYRRYVQKHPDSRNRVKAEEHIAILELERAPTLDGYAAFMADYPDSTLAGNVRETLEPRAFERARFAGTPGAYTEFMALYPDGPFSDRALGNMVFLEAGGFANSIGGLADFAAAHPKSDYAVEALKSLEAIEVKKRGLFDRVGLVVRVSPETPEASRVIGAFTDRAKRQFKASGQQLAVVPELQTRKTSAFLPKARLVIEHKEAQAKAKLAKGDFSRPGMHATTRVSLYSASGEKPIWQRVFRLRLNNEQHFAGTSMLFNPAARGYWDSFFVPVASWQNQATVRKPFKAEKKIVAVDSVGDRTAVLFPDGEFQLLELADAQEAFPLAKYKRAKDFTRWGGVKILERRVLIYGEDGIEVVGFAKGGARKLAGLERQTIGSVVDVVPLEGQLILGGSRGLLMTDKNAGNPRRLLRRPVKGLTRVGDLLVFTDGASVYASTLELLGEQRVLQEVELGYEFGPTGVVGFDRKTLVIGKAGVAVIDFANPNKPKLVSKLSRKKVGRVADAAAIGDRIFLVGERGLQLLDRSGKRVVEAVDIEPRERVARMGRFLVAAGEPGLQVVDGAPLTLALTRRPVQGAAAPGR